MSTGWWTCPTCGHGHARGFWPIGSIDHRCMHCGYVGDGGTVGHRPMLLLVQPHRADHVLVTWEAGDMTGMSVVHVYWSSVEGELDAEQVGDPPAMPPVVLVELLEGLRHRYRRDRHMTIDQLLEIVWG